MQYSRYGFKMLSVIASFSLLMHCLKVSAADTKAQKIEASVENRFPV